MNNEKNWRESACSFDDGVGTRASIGLIALSSDRSGAWDFEQFLHGAPDVAVFSTRIPMAPVATPETLGELKAHLESATQLLVPGSRLDCVALSCTSGTVAVGVDEVHAAIGRVRPGLPVATPIEAGAKGLERFGAKRISLLVPYLLGAANLISGYFEESGTIIDRRMTFGLDGDLQMNAVAGEALLSAALACMHPDSDALFISCTGLRTSPVVARIEEALGKPVVTSNQALAWDCLRLSGVDDKLPGRGRLFSEH